MRAQAAFECAVAYAQQRHAFGKPISNFQMIQNKISEMETRLQYARLLVTGSIVMYGGCDELCKCC